MSDFHMVVCVKAVPGSTEVKMDPKTNTIVRDGKQAVINPFDASALECALALKDDFIGFGMDVRVTVVSMGIPATESLLRDCIARGADDALLLTDRAFAGADTLATTYALKCGIEALDEDFDLLICGKMAVDGDTAQIGPELAGAFEIPCVTDVSCVQSVGFTTCGSLALVHGCDAGEETVYLEMPCAMTTAKEIGQLRMPSIAGIRAAEDAGVPRYRASAPRYRQRRPSAKTRCARRGPADWGARWRYCPRRQTRLRPRSGPGQRRRRR